jgi:hypothetical protein
MHGVHQEGTREIQRKSYEVLKIWLGKSLTVV